MLDLVKILKDCPKGTKLYSTIHGEVAFDRVEVAFDHVDDTNIIYPIVVKYNDSLASFTGDGKYYIEYDGECVLFPSKDQRDWSKFERFWDKPKRECFDPKTLQPFDRVLARYNKSCRWKALFFSHCYVTQDNENIYVCDSAEYIYCIPYNDNTKHLVGTKDEAPKYYRYWEN